MRPQNRAAGIHQNPLISGRVFQSPLARTASRRLEKQPSETHTASLSFYGIFIGRSEPLSKAESGRICRGRCGGYWPLGEVGATVSPRQRRASSLNDLPRDPSDALPTPSQPNQTGEELRVSRADENQPRPPHDQSQAAYGATSQPRVSRGSFTNISPLSPGRAVARPRPAARATLRRPAAGGGRRARK